MPQGQKPYSRPRPSFPVLGVGGGAKGERRREGWSGSCPAPLDSACTWLQSWGQREDQTECVPCFPPLSPKDVASLSAPPLESLPPLGCCTSHVQIHLVVGTVGVDGAQRVFPNLVSMLICLILASRAARHLPAHLADTRQWSRATPARSSA